MILYLYTIVMGSPAGFFWEEFKIISIETSVKEKIIKHAFQI